ncbi:hypothetical protein [Neisseria sicca]|nr:hypothetical protein [Neisseria sicca]
MAKSCAANFANKRKTNNTERSSEKHPAPFRRPLIIMETRYDPYRPSSI